MNAVMIWLGFPLVIVLLAFVLRRLPDIAYPMVMMACVFLIGLSFFITIDEPFQLGENTVVIGSSLLLGGRLIVLDEAGLTTVNFVYFVTLLWMFAGWRLRPNRFFPSFGFLIVILLLGGLFVQPSFYAGFLFLIAAFLFVPLWVRAGSVPPRSVYRFLVMMFFGMPFFFLAGWQFSLMQLGLDNQLFLVRGGIFLSLGVLAFLSAFPMHSWIPMMSDDAHPVILGFYMTTFPFIVMRFFATQVFENDLLTVMGQDFQMVWLVVSAITLLLGGYGLAIARKVTRFLAYYLIFAVGVGMMAMAVFDVAMLGVERIWWLATVVNVMVFVFALAPFEKEGYEGLDLSRDETDLVDSRRLGVLLLAMVPMLGLPFSMGFVGLFGIFDSVVQTAAWTGMLILLGLVGVFVFMGKLLRRFFVGIDWRLFRLSFEEQDDADDAGIVLQNRWWVFGFACYYALQIGFGVFAEWFVKLGIR